MINHASRLPEPLRAAARRGTGLALSQLRSVVAALRDLDLPDVAERGALLLCDLEAFDGVVRRALPLQHRNPVATALGSDGRD